MHCEQKKWDNTSFEEQKEKLENFNCGKTPKKNKAGILKLSGKNEW